MTKIERVIKVCKWLIFCEIAENNTDLAKKLGYSISSFSQILNEKVPLSDKFIDKLISLDKNINRDWITEGLNKMLLIDYNTDSNSNVNFENLQRIAEIETFEDNEKIRIYNMIDLLIREVKERK